MRCSSYTCVKVRCSSRSRQSPGRRGLRAHPDDSTATRYSGTMRTARRPRKSRARRQRASVAQRAGVGQRQQERRQDEEPVDRAVEADEQRVRRGCPRAGSGRPGRCGRTGRRGTARCQRRQTALALQLGEAAVRRRRARRRGRVAGSVARAVDTRRSRRPRACTQVPGQGVQRSTILPMCWLDSISRCACAASSSGSTRSTTGRTAPAATAGQTCAAHVRDDRRLLRRGTRAQRGRVHRRALGQQRAAGRARRGRRPAAR